MSIMLDQYGNPMYGFQPYSETRTGLGPRTNWEPKMLPKPDTTVQELRHLLQRFVDREEQRHPDFQDKELLREAKETINKSRK